MGIYTNGKMIVGASIDDILVVNKDFLNGKDDVYEWVEDNGLEVCSPWFDADVDSCTIGYAVDNVRVDAIGEIFVLLMSKLGDSFFELTGCKASLIGMQNVS